MIRVGFLITEYKIKDRIKLYKINPELEKEIFLGSLIEFIKIIKKENGQNPKMKKWINSVDKLMVDIKK